MRNPLAFTPSGIPPAGQSRPLAYVDMRPHLEKPGTEPRQKFACRFDGMFNEDYSKDGKVKTQTMTKL